MNKKSSVALILVLTLLLNFTASAQKNFAGSRPTARDQTDQKSTLEYATAAAYFDGAGVAVQWQTSVESGNIGFNVYRISAAGKEPVNTSLIPSAFIKTGESVTRDAVYAVYDEKGGADSQYVIESYAPNARSIASQFFGVTTTTDKNDGMSAARSAQPITNETTINPPSDLKTQLDINQPASDLPNHRAIVALPGVKIGVKQTGFYRVTRAELQSAGFNVNAAPATWKLYFEGVEQAINVAPNGDYIEFYGRGIDAIEADTRFYNLIAGGANGKRIAAATSRSRTAIAATTYSQTYKRRERTAYYPNLLNGEAENYFGTFVSNSADSTINFPLTAVDLQSPTVRFVLKIQGISTTQQNITVTLNDVALSPLTGFGYQAMSNTYRLTGASLREGTNTLKLRSTVGFSVVHSLQVDYDRRYVAQQNSLGFYTDRYKTTTISGFTSPNVRVFDLTRPDNITRDASATVTANGADYSVALASTPARSVFAVEDSALLHPASIVQNTPSTLTTAGHNGNLTIISYGAFMTQANAWANYRRAQGISVEVVDVADIFDEFSYGVSSSLAIRNFIKYAEDNWQTAPQYVLIIGDASFDPRNYEGFGAFNYVPTKFVDTIYTTAPSDEALADFNDDGLSEIAIGRIPARTGDDVTIVLNKVMTYEQTAAQWDTRGMLFASDSPIGYDFEALSHRLANLLPSTVTKTFVNRDQPDSQNLLVNDMNTGKSLVNYTGHGNASVWENENFFSKNNILPRLSTISPTVPILNNTDKYSLFVMLSCLNGYFVDPYGSLADPASPSPRSRIGLSEKLLLTPNGGAATTWSSTGLTTPDIQEIMATRFYQQLAAGNLTRMGDLVKDAKSTVVGGRDVRLSWTLLGDPMLKVR